MQWDTEFMVKKMEKNSLFCKLCLVQYSNINFMKNPFIVLFTVITLLFGGNAFLHAQNLGGGLSFGANFAQIDDDNVGGFNQAGLSLGGFTVFQLNDWLQLQPEMIFDQIGARTKDGSYNVRFNYIDIPLLVNFKIGVMLGDEKHDLKLQAGPVFGFLMNATDRLNNISQTDAYNRVDPRGAVGASFELSSDISFVARFQYSLTRMAKGNIPGFNTGPFHNYVQVAVRWWLVE